MTEAEAQRLLSLARKRARTLRLPEDAILSPSHRSLRTKQVCGLMSVGATSLEILPKLRDSVGEDRQALIRMLTIAHDLRIDGGETAEIERPSSDLLEVFGRMFLRKLGDAARKGLPRAYVAFEDDLPKLRGRLDIQRQFTQHAARSDRLACRFDEFAADIPVNRLLHACLALLRSRLNGEITARLIRQLSIHFEEVGLPARPLDETFTLDRSTGSVSDCVPLARFLLAAQHQNTHAGSDPGFGLMFAMNDLFEAYVAQLARRAFGPRARKQAQGRAVMTNGLFRMKPDLILELENETVIVDTKWKRLETTKSNLGVSQSDVYQMLAYSAAYSRSSVPTRLMLLFPRQASSTSQVHTHWEVAETNVPFQIASYDVGEPDPCGARLKKLLEVCNADLV
jgi:5-methylcytosine-specific restriction enzyme subunit McrC